MLTYELKKSGFSLFETLYMCIRDDINSGRLKAGEKLPSKRALAEHLQISKTTVENAYYQLVTEGYLKAEPKRGFFVERIEPTAVPGGIKAAPIKIKEEAENTDIDLTGSRIGTEQFPFSVWARLMRRVLTENRSEVLAPIPYKGTVVLREAIAAYLYRFRGIAVDPEQIIIGAGTEYLYGLLIRLLGEEKCCGVENPGYPKIRQIYTVNGATCADVPLDEYGARPDALEKEGVNVLHITASHHFPTGIVMPLRRRQEILDWASGSPGRYIIEDDYDCEFRFAGKPVPALQSIDSGGKVIYINTFTKSLTPSIRIGYMILPPELIKRYSEKLGFYSCAVCSFEQFALASFLNEGYFERHIARMKKHYRTLRDGLIETLKLMPGSENAEITGKDSGLHFIMKFKEPSSREKIEEVLRFAGIRAAFLSDYLRTAASPEEDRSIVVNYSGINTSDINKIRDRLTGLRFN
ncbi:MAG: PLP-dependent aminotransferase family protein [Clostridiales bacterium]|nr:PLP-dependent aminotransferase family protein [Clostridiales bacterium]